VVIDLSHGIGSDNANAATFLRDDCINVTRFFARRGACTLSPRTAFEFVIRKLDDDNRVMSNAQDDVLFEMESNLIAEVALSQSSDSDATTDLDDASSELLIVDDVDVNVELARRAARREQRATPLLDELIANHGQTGAFEKHSMSAADAAFMDKHMPRPLHEVTDVTKFSIDELNTFGLIATK